MSPLRVQSQSLTPRRRGRAVAPHERVDRLAIASMESQETLDGPDALDLGERAVPIAQHQHFFSPS
jgi:hypothetical protein